MPPLKRAIWIVRHRKPQAVIAVALMATLALVLNTSNRHGEIRAGSDAARRQGTQPATFIDMESARPEAGQGQE
jgi:hypothetical protein